MKRQPADPPDSSALHLIRHVWGHNREGTGFSWTRLNGSMHGAVNLAIEAGLKFDLGDFEYLAKHFRIGYWGGNDGHMCGEGFYSHAVRFDHISACQSFEAWKDRKPFTWEGERISIGHEFTWKSERVWCTSFAKDGLSLVACSQKGWKLDGKGHIIEGSYDRSPKHVHKITNDDLSAARKALKPAKKAIAAEATV